MSKYLLLLGVSLLIFFISSESIYSQVLELESTTEGFLPPQLNNGQRDAILNPQDGMVIFNLSTGYINYYDGGENRWVALYPGPHTSTPDTNTINDVLWELFAANAQGIQFLLDAGVSPLNIINAGADTADFNGLVYQGGTIVFANTDGTGLIAADQDIRIFEFFDFIFDFQWGCLGSGIPGADDMTIGAGLQNTLDIANNCMTADSIAAEVSLDFEAPFNNPYTDWHLPSLDELKRVVKHGKSIFTSYLSYWSSTEASTNQAYRIDNMGPGVSDKDTEMRVRPVRYY